MKLVFSYFKMYMLSTFRNPPALFFTMIFPLLIFLVSAHSWGSDPTKIRSAFLVFTNYGVQTVCFMVLGMGVSQEKNSDWFKYVRSLPAGINTMIAGRVLHTVCLSFLNIFFLFLVGFFIFSIPITFLQFLNVLFFAFLGAIPFCLMGMTIGYAAHADSCRTIFTILNLLFLFATFSFPDTGFLSQLKLLVLTVPWFSLQESIFVPSVIRMSALLCLAVYTLVFLYLFRKVYARTVD